jgi:phage terminase large subunit-like protein
MSGWRMTMGYKLNEHIKRYVDIVEQKEVAACADQRALIKLVRKSFRDEEIYTDSELLEKYLGLARYFPFKRVFPWEAFCIALHLCTFWGGTEKKGEPRWPDLLLCAGRGAGKDGFIALCSFALVSPYHAVRGYDVDICANSEDQAQRPMKDIIAALDDVRNASKLRKHYHKTAELVRGIKNGGTVKGRTSNPKSKDGMRSGMVVFNETHQYADYRQVKVFLTGRGKVAHPRTLIATTRGDVRDGPLDDDIRRAEGILKGAEADNGFLPVLFRLDEKSDVNNPDFWVKANPSLPYLPALRREIEREFIDWQGFPEMNGDFLTKRMNLPQTTADVAVTDWANIEAAGAAALPELRGHACVAGIDYASTSDFVSVNLHFIGAPPGASGPTARIDNTGESGGAGFNAGYMRYDINHSWLCLRSRDLSRIQAPWREWAENGSISVVDDVEIHPDLVAEWLFEAGSFYDIRGLALDNYRYALVARSLERVGFDAASRKNVRLVRPSDIMKVQPVIASAFANHNFVWGNNRVLMWAANNTKLVRSSRAAGVDTGNFIYAKIEARSRKTDPFMALVASMTAEDMLPGTGAVFDDLPVIVA